jgi:hypothetical protein
MTPAVKILGISGRIEDKQLAFLAEKMNITLLPKPISSERLLTNLHTLLKSAEPSPK